MSDLAALRERVAKATGGSRELDAEIEVVVRNAEAARSGVDRQYWSTWKASSTGLVGDGQGCTYFSQCASTQTDCAIRAAHRAIPDCWIRLDFQKDRGWRCEVADEVASATHAKATLAILAALLAALDTRRQG